MARHALVWVIGSALNAWLLTGCGDDSDDEVDEAADEVDEAADEVDETADESNEGSDQGESGSGDGGEGGGSASTSGTATTDGTSTDETDGTDEGACPDSPDSSPCESCVLESCCEQLLACENSESCSCMYDCVEAGGEQIACLLECGLDRPDLLYGQFVSCAQAMCLERCA